MARARTNSGRRRGTRSGGRDPVVIASAAAAALVLVLTVVGGVFASGLSDTPGWWIEAQRMSEARPSAGIELENRISRALTRVRDEPEWAAAIEEADLNAWLASRLEETVRTHFGDDAWRPELRAVRVALDADALTVGARMGHEHGTSIVWARLRLRVDDAGRFHADPLGAYIGTTRVPVFWASGVLEDGDLGAATIDLGDGREVLVRGVRAAEGRLEFAMTTRLAGAG